MVLFFYFAYVGYSLQIIAFYEIFLQNTINYNELSRYILPKSWIPHCVCGFPNWSLFDLLPLCQGFSIRRGKIPTMYDVIVPIFKRNSTLVPFGHI
jgi:hypothetical protein